MTTGDATRSKKSILRLETKEKKNEGTERRLRANKNRIKSVAT